MVRLAVLPPTILHLVVKRSGNNTTKDMLPLVQLLTNITKPLGVSKSHFYQTMAKLGAQKKKAAPLHLVTTLKKIGGISHTSPKCDLVTIHTAAKLLTQLSIPKLVVDSLLAKVCASDFLSDTDESASDSPSDSESPSDSSDSESPSDSECDEDEDASLQEEEEEMEEAHHHPESKAAAEPAKKEEDVAVLGLDADATDDDDEPATAIFTTSNSSKPPRYGLTSIKHTQERQACLSNIQLQVNDFKAWSQALYQPGRPSDLLQQGTKTWESQQKRVYEYLGYLYHYLDIKRPTLDNYMDVDYFLGFLDFLRGRAVDKAGHTKAVHAAFRAVSYLKGLAATDQGRAKAALRSLKALGTQLGQNMVPKPKAREPEQLKEQGRWMDAPELLARVEAVRLAALAHVDGMKAGTVPRVEAAKAVHNALLATMCFGYMPPLRHNSVLLNLTGPPHLGCRHPDCQHKAAGCLGNRVHRHPTSGTWWLDIPHHKNTKAWKGVALKFELPTEVAGLVDHHITWAHSTLTGHTEQPAAPNLFVNTSTGLPLKDQEVSQVWSKTVLDGSGVHFGPQLCRSIFVSGTRDAALPNPAGMAMIMGNSQGVWDSVYDRHFNTREAQAAMQLMPAWRQQMLTQAKQASSTPPTPPAKAPN